MEPKLVDVLLELYGECPKCKRKYIGVDLDVKIKENFFLRLCSSCGWSMELEKRENPKKQMSRNGTCKIIDCDSPIKARELCEMHYARQRRGKLEVRPYRRK